MFQTVICRHISQMVYLIVLAKKLYRLTFETTTMLANLATKLTAGVFWIDTSDDETGGRPAYRDVSVIYHISFQLLIIILFENKKHLYMYS